MASDMNYKQIEKDVFNELNTIRTNPRSYVSKLQKLKTYINGKIIHPPNEHIIEIEEGIKAVDNAIEFLNKQTALNELTYNDSLHTVAINHAKDIGQRGVNSHEGVNGINLSDRIEKVIEWDNQIEATVICSIGSFQLAFFAVDYYCNKSLYKIGETISMDISSLGMNVSEGQRGFQFEGQKAIDWLAKIGKEPNFDQEGNVEPIHFGLENLVAFIDSNTKCPNEAEFQSPGSGVEICSILNTDFYKTNIMICRREIEEEIEVSIPLYFRKDYFPDFKDNDPVCGMIWIIGNISGMHDEVAIESK
jgi:hypothetical protein